MSSCVDSAVEYRDIPDFPGYRVGSDGSVWSCWGRRSRGYHNGTEVFLSTKWKKRVATKNHDGYRMLILSKDKKHYCRKVCSLVLTAFIGPRQHGMQACHNNGIADDDRLDNLRWDTVKANHVDKQKHGTVARGDRIHTSKLDKDRVRQIRALAASVTQVELAKMFGVRQCTISQIIRREIWSWLDD